jgi:hypothetical protein
MQIDAELLLKRPDGNCAPVEHRVEHQSDYERKVAIDVTVGMDFATEAGAFPGMLTFARRSRSERSTQYSTMSAPAITGVVSSEVNRDLSRAQVIDSRHKRSLGVAIPFVNLQALQRDLDAMRTSTQPKRIPPSAPFNSDERKVELEAPLLVHKKPLTTRKAAESPTFMEAPPTPRTDGAKRRALNTIKARQQGDAYRQPLQETLSEMLRAEFRAQGTRVSNEHLQRGTHDALQSVSGHSRAEIRTQLINLGVAVSDSLVSNESHYLSKALRYIGDMVVEGLVGRAAHAASPSTQAPRQLGRGYAGITQAAVKRLKLPGADAALLGKKARGREAKKVESARSQAPKDNKASVPSEFDVTQRREAMLRESQEENYIAGTREVRILAGALVDAAEGSVKALKEIVPLSKQLAASALRAERDRVLSQSLLVGVFAPKIQKDAEKRHQVRKEKIA